MSARRELKKRLQRSIVRGHFAKYEATLIMAAF